MHFQSLEALAAPASIFQQQCFEWIMINLPKITVSHNHNKVFSYLMHISIRAPYVWVATTL